MPRIGKEYDILSASNRVSSIGTNGYPKIMQ